MKGLRAGAVVVVVAVLVALCLLVRSAVQVALGYSAKQYCSAVFISRLPGPVAEHLDIRPRMAALGPLQDQLQLRADPATGVAEAELLGARVRAVHRDRMGCTLHGEGSGRPPLPMPEETAASPGVPAPLQPAFDRAFAEPGGDGRNTLVLLVSRHGKLLAERYAEPVTAATRLQGWSMNKSLMATWVGVQARRGQLDPAAPVANLLGNDPLARRVDPRLTLLHLLQMESGLDFQEVYGPVSDVTRMLYRSEAMWRVPAGQSQAYEPGSHFAYSSGDTVLASVLWQRSLNEPYPQWLKTHFQAPLGIDSLVAEADASGVQVGSSFAYQTARDWLRTGQLWLDAWHGRSPLLDQQWLRDSVAPRASDSRGRYGRGFWLNTGEVAFQGMPQSLFYAGGNAGQYVVVVPEWELVVVRLGLTDAASRTGMDSFLRSLAALELSP